MLVAVDRYVAICKPLKASLYSTMPKVQKAVAAVWAFSIIYNIPRCFERELVLREHETVTSITDILALENDADLNSTDVIPKENATELVCLKTTLRTDYLYIVIYKDCFHFVFRVFLPFLGICFCTFHLYREIKKSNQESKRISNAKHTRYTSMLLVVNVVFLICSLPDLCIRLVMVRYSREPDSVHVPQVLKCLNAVSNLLFTVSSCCNFIIYTFIGPRFRKELWQLICCRDLADQ